jgi:myo-inositol-1(or 4)-monophosphatase
VTDAEFAGRLVTESADLARGIRSRGRLATTEKSGPGDIVTEADQAAEALMSELLATAMPDDGIIGEEGTARESLSGRDWVLDPVDGTTNFAAGLPHWCSAAGIVAEGVALLGAVAAPDLGELWIGGPGRPTTLNGIAVPGPRPRSLERGVLATYLHPGSLTDPGLASGMTALLDTAATVRMLGSGTAELAAVAAGRLDAWVQHDCSPWDWHPGAALVIGAGGVAVVIEVDGHSWHLAGSAEAVADMEALLRST